MHCIIVIATTFLGWSTMHLRDSLICEGWFHGRDKFNAPQYDCPIYLKTPRSVTYMMMLHCTIQQNISAKKKINTLNFALRLIDDTPKNYHDFDMVAIPYIYITCNSYIDQESTCNMCFEIYDFFTHTHARIVALYIYILLCISQLCSPPLEWWHDRYLTNA